MNNDVLDLIKLKSDLIGVDIKPHIDKTEYLLCFNPYGGFRAEYANQYIQNYLATPRGCTQSLVKRIPWVAVQLQYNNPRALDVFEKSSDPVLKFYCLKLQQFALDNSYYHQTDYKPFAINNSLKPTCRRLSRYAGAPDHVQNARNEIMATNEVIDQQKTLCQQRSFGSFKEFNKWVEKLEDALQFDMIVEEFLGFVQKGHQWKVGCSYVNCVFEILFDYSLEFGADGKMHEKFIMGDDVYNKFYHVHDETQQYVTDDDLKISLGKKYGTKRVKKTPKQSYELFPMFRHIA